MKNEELRIKNEELKIKNSRDVHTLLVVNF